MPREADDPAPGRADTDASISVERATADSAFAEADAQRRLEILIGRDRVLADHRVMLFRQRADRNLAQARSLAPPGSDEVIEERHAADEGMRAERSVTDALLESERRSADGREECWQEEQMAAHVERESQRVDTNARLANERSMSDAVSVDRDTGRSALAAADLAQMRREDVFAMVAHDLRSPLFVILGNAELLAESVESEELREVAQDVTVAAGRMGRLLTDLMDVAQIDAGQFPLAKASRDVRALLLELRRACLPLVESRGLRLVIDVPETELIASIDHDRVTQVLTNLLGNAMKFTPAGGRVALHVEPGGEALVFVVTDDGAGIPPESLPHIFDRFWQRDSDTRRGLGLGLYICKAIAEAHGGGISVQSEPGVGSVFRVSLPVT